MKQLETGRFFGQTNSLIQLDGLTLTDTEYTQPKVDWHYHQNPYFTFLLQGNMLEGNKKEVYHCAAGALLFHHWQDPHYNVKPGGFTRGFHIELEQSWMTRFSVSIEKMQGSLRLHDPDLKLLLYQIFRETKRMDGETSLSIHSLLLEVISAMSHTREPAGKTEPRWVKTARELLQEQGSEAPSLQDLSRALGIHPVHLSRQFPKYFHCHLGQYLRKVKVEKSLALLPNQNYSLTEIGFECGFTDQSHFIRCFKEAMGITPLAYRRLFRR